MSMRLSEPSYEFDQASLLKYNNMSFGGPPVTVDTQEEAGKLLQQDEMESAVGNEKFDFCIPSPNWNFAVCISPMIKYKVSYMRHSFYRFFRNVIKQTMRRI